MNPIARVLAADFEKRYGVKVSVWRASTVKVVQRLLAEKQANRWDFDAVDISAPEMEALYREGALQEVSSALHARLLPETLQSHRGWAPQSESERCEREFDELLRMRR